MNLFLNYKNPFIYGFVGVLAALLFSITAPAATPNNVVVAFDSAGGTPVSMVTLPGGGRLETIPTTSKEGYTFEGWLKGNDPVTLQTVFTTNTTVRADFKEITFSISYQTNGGVNLEDEVVGYGETLRLPIPTKTDAVFLGWYEEASFTTLVDATIEVFKDYVFYAKWSVIGSDLFTVTYFSEGLGLVDTVLVQPNTTITLITPPTRTGFTFSNWVDGITFTDVVTNTYLVTSDVVFFAKWTSLSPMVTITFDTQGGTPIPSIQVPEGTTWQDPETVPFLGEGYQFLKWITGCNFDGFNVTCITLDESFVIDEDLVALAQYDYMVPLQNMIFETVRIDDQITGYMLAGVDNFTTEEPISTLILPSTFAGLPVVMIGEYAFEDAEYLEKVIIPENIRFIDYGAFMNSSIEEIFLPNSLEKIWGSAFQGSSLNSIHLDVNESQLKEIHYSSFAESLLTDFTAPRSLEYIGSEVFKDTPLETFTVPSISQLGYIGYNAFYSTELVNLTLPEGLKTIQSGAFDDTPTLKHVSLPASVNYLGNYVWRNASLESFVIAQGSQLLEVGENIFATDTTPQPFIQDFIDNGTSDLLIVGPMVIAYRGVRDDQQPLVIPEGVQVILNNVFDDVSSALDKGKLTLPNSLRYIGEEAFLGASFTGDVTFPDHLYIDENAFFDAHFTGDILFEEVRKIEDDAFNSVTAVDVIFADNTIYGPRENLEGGIFRYTTILSLTMGEGYEELPYQFLYYSNVKEVHLPDSLVKLREQSLGAPSLEVLTFQGDSLLLDVQSNALSGAENSLWYQNQGNYIVLKNNLYRINLSGLSSPYTLTIPAGVKIINSSALFPNNQTYTSIDFNEVTYILNNAFNQWNGNLNLINPVTLSNLSYFGYNFTFNLNSLMSNGKITFEDLDFDIDYLLEMNQGITYELNNNLAFDNQGFKRLGNLLFEYSVAEDDTPSEVTIPSEVEWIVSQAFYGVEFQGPLTLNEGLRVIGNDAFYNAEFMQASVSLPASLEVIQSSAFNNTNLTSVTLPSTLKEVRSYAFDIDTLTSITIEDPESLEFQNSVFGDLPSNPNELSSALKPYLINNFLIVNGMLMRYYGFQKDVVIPSGVTTILDDAFTFRNETVQSIRFPASLKVLKNYALSGILNLRSVDFSLVTALRYLGEGVFANTPLRTIVINAPITEVSPYVLSQLPYLQSYTLNLLNPITLYFNLGYELND